MFSEKYAEIQDDSSKFKVDEDVIDTIRFTTPVYVAPSEEETSESETSGEETSESETGEEESTKEEKSSESDESEEAVSEASSEEEPPNIGKGTIKCHFPDCRWLFWRKTRSLS